MKSLLVIGMGRFGSKLATRLYELGNDVMIVDKDSEKVQALSSFCTDAQIGDCTNIDVLRSLGVGNFDVCFVAIGENFQASLEITSLLKELGAKKVLSKADSDIQCKFLLRNGADEVIYPTRDIAQRIAIKTSAKNMFDFLEISSDFSISEMPIPSSWIGKSVSAVDVRKKFQLNILAIKKDGRINSVPSPEYVFDGNDHIIVAGQVASLMKFSDKL